MPVDRAGCPGEVIDRDGHKMRLGVLPSPATNRRAGGWPGWVKRDLSAPVAHGASDHRQYLLNNSSRIRKLFMLNVW